MPLYLYLSAYTPQLVLYRSPASLRAGSKDSQASRDRLIHVFSPGWGERTKPAV